MAGRQHRRAQVARGMQQIVEFDRLIAFHAGHRRLAGNIALGKAVDHRFPEPGLVIEDVMRNADALGNGARVMDVAAGAAGALAMRCRAVIVKLQRDADDVVAGVRQDRGGDRGIDATGHGDNHARRRRRSLDVEQVRSHAAVPGRRPVRHRLNDVYYMGRGRAPPCRRLPA